MTPFWIFFFMWIGIAEVIFIIGRFFEIVDHDEWAGWKVASFFISLFLTFIQYSIVVFGADMNTYHWGRLLIEGYILGGIGVFFIANYFISKLIEKFQ